VLIAPDSEKPAKRQRADGHLRGEGLLLGYSGGLVVYGGVASFGRAG